MKAFVLLRGIKMPEEVDEDDFPFDNLPLEDKKLLRQVAAAVAKRDKVGLESMKNVVPPRPEFQFWEMMDLFNLKLKEPPSALSSNEVTMVVRLGDGRGYAVDIALKDVDDDPFKSVVLGVELITNCSPHEVVVGVINI